MAVLKYLFGRRGPLTSTGCDHGAFLDTTGRGGEPDLQMRFVAGCALDADGVQSYVKFGDMKKAGIPWPAGITLQLLAVRSKSRGSVGACARARASFGGGGSAGGKGMWWIPGPVGITLQLLAVRFKSRGAGGSTAGP
eukprot:150487-Chlamydomonas_euryale.AAC.1